MFGRYQLDSFCYHYPALCVSIYDSAVYGTRDIRTFRVEKELFFTTW